MPKIKINGRELEVEPGTTVLRAALDNGIYIPHYCYHPHLPIAGNCRMCLVEIKPGPPKPSIACNTVVADNMEIETDNDRVNQARQAVLEFLLKNHPLDCPICDQAGECWLQHYYMMYDRKPSRLLGPEEKIRKRKARRMGQTLVLDSERCILCTRCVRIMRDVVHDDCLVIANRNDRAEITTFPGRVIESPYSLCLADACPVGAWTSADFRFKQRVWFLEPSPSICPHCSRGCNIFIDHRRGEVFRFRPRRNDAVNKSWACDEGLLSYHAINDGRLTAPRVKKDGGQAETGWDEALGRVVEAVKNAGGNLVVAVSASLALEDGKKVLSLFKDKLGAKVFLHTGAPSWEDDILHRADKNANTKGLSDLGIAERTDAGAPSGAVVIALETVCPELLPASWPAPAVTISPTLSKAVETATVAIPVASFAESAGTVVNFEGVAQSYAPALRPKGQALPYGEVLERVAKALGHKLGG